MSKIVAIYSGSFATTGTGNFNAYDAVATDRIHVPAQVIEKFGITEDTLDKAEFPFFAVVSEREFNVLDEADAKGVRSPKVDKDGEPLKMQRLQAGTLFKTQEQAISALNSNASINLQAKADLVKQAKGLELTADVLKELQVAF